MAVAALVLSRKWQDTVIHVHWLHGTTVLSPYAAGGDFAQYKMMQKIWKMTKTLANWYSSESTRWELSNEYQHDRVSMVFKNLCQFGQYKVLQKNWKMLEILAYGYSSESTRWELSNEYQQDRVQMFFKNLCIFVLWAKAAPALEGFIMN